MTRLKPKRCPVRHSPAQVLVDWDGGQINGHYRHFVACCTCGNHSTPMDTCQEAILIWNSNDFPFEQLRLFEGGAPDVKA